MGRTFSKKRSTVAAEIPIQWTDSISHKYCGATDMGRNGKPNKAHRCAACKAIKAQQASSRDGPKDIKGGRLDKLAAKLECAGHQ
ncbi:hypothetical protein C8A05DRAFT_36971 [Staphylotrichum tortipilum]|uniref:Uncharacterized protein n=1 Tax=Staphylotrichum tortipilum TaxID=2831512 RepID=A0AAN6MEP2_9PEZI|nr:hypothetical protein C8A05DRAFT_36971 [Staphylotrichum longicolle]